MQKKSTSGLYKRLSTKRSITLKRTLITDSHKLCLYKLRPYKLRLYKLRLYKLRLYKLRLRKLRPHKLRPHKLCLRELRPTKNLRKNLCSNLHKNLRQFHQLFCQFHQPFQLLHYKLSRSLYRQLLQSLPPLPHSSRSNCSSYTHIHHLNRP